MHQFTYVVVFCCQWATAICKQITAHDVVCYGNTQDIQVFDSSALFPETTQNVGLPTHMLFCHAQKQSKRANEPTATHAARNNQDVYTKTNQNHSIHPPMAIPCGGRGGRNRHIRSYSNVQEGRCGCVCTHTHTHIHGEEESREPENKKVESQTEKRNHCASLKTKPIQ